MVKAVKGVLVQCDESIKAIIEKLDKDHGHVYILESLDDTTLLCAAGKILELKAKLKEYIVQNIKEHVESESD